MIGRVIAWGDLVYMYFCLDSVSGNKQTQMHQQHAKRKKCRPDVTFASVSQCPSSPPVAQSSSPPVTQFPSHPVPQSPNLQYPNPQLQSPSPLGSQRVLRIVSKFVSGIVATVINLNWLHYFQCL